MIPLKLYIDIHFKGSNVEFAKAQGVTRQQVNEWKIKGYMVSGDKMYSCRRQLALK